MIVPYRGYSTRDGFIVIAAGNDRLFATLCEVLGHPEWISDERFKTNAARVKNQKILYAGIGDIVGQKTSAEWATILDGAGVPNAPMQNVGGVLAHPQTAALEIVQTSPDGEMSLLGLPLSFDGERPPFRRVPPSLGEHTSDIFNELKSGKPR
jgi:crotonobetainyl-CoA:carnitine CoA-transferase CaiB-like acyl-CoA transferase